MLNGIKVAILVADGFEQAEWAEPKKALDEAGAETHIVSPAKGQDQGWKHFDKADKFPVRCAARQSRCRMLRRPVASRRCRQSRSVAYPDVRAARSQK
jgi:putative intracellular protease/amidase